MAQRVATFIGAATRTLEIALYDLRLEATQATMITDALSAAMKRGVAVRLVFNQDHARTAPEPPPPSVDWDYIHQLQSIGVNARPIPGVPDLMHHKYVVRDAGISSGAVLTGSTNWTTDSWTREENVMFSLSSSEIATYYRENFEELWNKPVVADSGRFDTVWTKIVPDSGPPINLRPYFCPGRGIKLVHAMSRSLALAKKRVRICSPVITAGPVLGTLAEVVHKGLDISGVYDATQMDEVLRQWGEDSRASWKIEAFKTVVATVKLGSKRSTPYAKGTVHDFMHAKMLVADDYVYAGSFNISHSGEENAENVMQIQNQAVADLCADYIDRVAARYGGRPLHTGSPTAV